MSPTRPGAHRAALLAASTVSAALAVLAPSASALLPTSHTASAHADRTATKPIKYKVSPAMFGMHDSSQISLTKPGVNSIRLWDTGTAWNNIETSPGTYDFSRLDQFVTAAQQRHVSVLLVLGQTPSFYSADPTEMPSSVDAYRNYVEAVMQRYQDWNGSRGIAAYQVWNEANISGYWTGTPQEMAQLTQAAWQAKQAVDPGVQIVAPALTASWKYMLRWVQAWAATTVDGQPVWHYVDVSSFNLYPLAVVDSRPGTPEDSVALLATVRSILASAGWPAKPIWNTEINYGLVGGATHPMATPISNKLQIAYVMRTYLLNAARGVPRVYWYAYDLGALANTQLTDPSDPSILTPAGRALTRIEAWMSGTLVGTATKRPCIPDANGTYTCLIKYASGVGRVYWNPYTTGRVTLAKSAHKKLDEYGVVTTVNGGQRIKVGYAPVLVRSRR